MKAENNTEYKNINVMIYRAIWQYIHSLNKSSKIILSAYGIHNHGSLTKSPILDLRSMQKSVG